MKTYYVLLVKYSSNDKWSDAFGDYDKEVVKKEAENSYMYSYATEIIKTLDSQVLIDAEIARLNSL